MRVGIIAFLNESNTFIHTQTTFEHFQQDLLADGEAVRERLANSHHEVGGFFVGLAEQGIDAVPIFAARALPFGVIRSDAFWMLMERMMLALDRAKKLDGILVAPHGATVAEPAPDADGYWLRQLRATVGPDMPIIGTLDLHANVSPLMIESCDALIAYRTNPHLDQKQRGIDAARLMARTLRGEVKPTMAGAFPNLAVNIERQDAASMPCKRIYDAADRMLTVEGILSNSVILGFPYSDVAEMGSSVLVVTNNDRELARRKADELASLWWTHRAEFVGQLTDISDAVKQASSMDGPICLLDMGDNVGGGSPGDGTLIAHELIRQQVGPSFVCLADAEVVKQVEHAGINAKLRVVVGGKSDDRHGSPLVLDVRVVGLFNGRFDEPEPRHGGFVKFDQGPTVVLESTVGLTVMVTTRRMAPFSLRQLTTFHVDPSKFRVLVAKGVHAPVAAYRPVCKALIRVNTPGVTCADMTALEYHHRRKPMFPFEE